MAINFGKRYLRSLKFDEFEPDFADFPRRQEGFLHELLTILCKIGHSAQGATLHTAEVLLETVVEADKKVISLATFNHGTRTICSSQFDGFFLCVIH